jgi:serine/threonine-protein kinase
MCIACNREFEEDVERCPSDGTMLITLHCGVEEFNDARFDTQRVLGKGRWTRVYRAKRLSDNQMVALKCVEHADTDVLQKYAHEAEHLSQLQHPNIVRLLDCGQLGAYEYLLVLDYIGEQTVQTLIEQKTKLSIEEVRSIILPLCDAFWYLHGRGEVHPFLKPSHIVLSDEDQRPVLIDFAQQYYAHEVRTISLGGAIFANGEYAAPEVITSKPVDSRANVYSLGCIMYAMLTGAPPFTADSPILLASKQLSEPPKRISEKVGAAAVPKEIEKLVMSMLEKQPDKRPTIEQVENVLS